MRGAGLAAGLAWAAPEGPGPLTLARVHCHGYPRSNTSVYGPVYAVAPAAMRK